MLKKLFKKDENSEFIFSNKLIIGLVVVAILVMIFIGRTNIEKPVDTVLENENQEITKKNNYQDTEKRLEEILKKIDGAGDVSVMIYYSSMGEKIVASDTKTRSEKAEKGEGVFDLSEDKEHNTVIYGGSGEEKPFVTEEKLPKPGGIIVISEGAKNEKVRYEISEAVRALLGLSPNRIKVVAKAKEQIN